MPATKQFAFKKPNLCTNRNLADWERRCDDATNPGNPTNPDYAFRSIRLP
jgi:hypothetical protein